MHRVSYNTIETSFVRCHECSTAAKKTLTKTLTAVDCIFCNAQRHERFLSISVLFSVVIMCAVRHTVTSLCDKC